MTAIGTPTVLARLHQEHGLVVVADREEPDFFHLARIGAETASLCGAAAHACAVRVLLWGVVSAHEERWCLPCAAEARELLTRHAAAA